MKKCCLFYLGSPPSQNSGASDMQQDLSHGSPQAPPRDRFLSEPQRFTFGSVSTERETEEESSSCFDYTDYTSDQVRKVLQLYSCFGFP